MVQLFVEVEDVAASAAKCEELGGRILMRPQILPDGDEIAIIAGIEGIPTGLLRPGPRAAGAQPSK